MREYQPYTDVMYLMTGYLICDTDEPRYPQFDVLVGIRLNADALSRIK